MEESGRQKKQRAKLWLSAVGDAEAKLMGSGRAECTFGELGAGQRRGPVRVVGGAALGGMAVGTEWLVVARAQEPAGVAVGELAPMAEPASGIDGGRGAGGQPAVERAELGAGRDPLGRPGLPGGGWW